MLSEGLLTLIIIIIFVSVLLFQIKVLNTVAKRQYNIQNQTEEANAQDLHKEGPEVKNAN